MAIDFGSLNMYEEAPVTPAPATTSGMSLNLNKNMTLDLTKRNPGLDKILLGAGWDVAESGSDFDLDISAFLLSNGKIRSVEDVIYFNHRETRGIRLHDDNRTGAGDGDDEKITISLRDVDSSVDAIAFCVTIFDAANRGQTFGKVRNAFVRLVNEANGHELCKFSLNTDYSTDTAIIFVKLKRNGGEWDFETIGEGKQADLNGLLAYFS